jgi:hypothetical protein
LHFNALYMVPMRAPDHIDVIDDAIPVADWQLLVKLIGHLRGVRDHLRVLRSSNPLKAVMVFFSAGASQRWWSPPRHGVPLHRSVPASVATAAATTENLASQLPFIPSFACATTAIRPSVHRCPGGNREDMREHYRRHQTAPKWQ